MRPELFRVAGWGVPTHEFFIALGIAVVDHIDPLIRLFDLHLGREGGFLERPFCIFGGCPIVSPLRFGKENAEVLAKVAKRTIAIQLPKTLLFRPRRQPRLRNPPRNDPRLAKS